MEYIGRIAHIKLQKWFTKNIPESVSSTLFLEEVVPSFRNLLPKFGIENYFFHLAPSVERIEWFLCYSISSSVGKEIQFCLNWINAKWFCKDESTSFSLSDFVDTIRFVTPTNQPIKAASHRRRLAPRHNRRFVGLTSESSRFVFPSIFALISSSYC